MKLVHWLLGGRSPPRPLLSVPNVTAHPLTASVPITVLLYNGTLPCGFNVPIKGLTTCCFSDRGQVVRTHTRTAVFLTAREMQLRTTQHGLGYTFWQFRLQALKTSGHHGSSRWTPAVTAYRRSGADECWATACLAPDASTPSTHRTSLSALAYHLQPQLTTLTSLPVCSLHGAPKKVGLPPAEGI